MAYSFILKSPLPADAPPRGRRVAVTGAAGRIGRSFAASAAKRYALRLLVHPEAAVEELGERGEVVAGDIRDQCWLETAFDGMDTVVHLAADPGPDSAWESLLPNNIIGTRNVFRAAIAAGLRRVVFASSIHAVSGYPAGHQVQPDEPVNPGDEYGVSKCFGEAMARYAATQHRLSAICIRIGAFQPRQVAVNDRTLRFMHCFVSHRDLDQLIACCIDNQTLQFAIVHGLSNNRFNRMDIGTAEELLGYEPQDDFTELNRELAALDLNRRVAPHNESRRADE